MFVVYRKLHKIVLIKFREKNISRNFRKMLRNLPTGKFPGKNSTNFRKMSGKFPTGKFPGKISGKFREIPGNSGKIPDGKISGETFGENSGKIYFLVNRIYKNPGNRINTRCSELLTYVKNNENR